MLKEPMVSGVKLCPANGPELKPNYPEYLPFSFGIKQTTKANIRHLKPPKKLPPSLAKAFNAVCKLKKGAAVQLSLPNSQLHLLTKLIDERLPNARFLIKTRSKYRTTTVTLKCLKV